MSPEEIAKRLTSEHYDILQRDREVKRELMELLVDQKMDEFFSVNWRKLYNTFVKGRI